MVGKTAPRNSFWTSAVPALILSIGIALSIFAFDRAQQADEERVRGALELRAEWRLHDFRNKLDDVLVPVEALAVFIVSQKILEPIEFYRFAELARSDDPIARLTWAPWVKDDARAAFEQAARQDGNPGYEIREIVPQSPSKLVPASRRNDYVPVLFEQLFEDRLPLVGFDFLSEPTRHLVAMRARDQGIAIATRPVPPAIGLDRTPSYTVFWPVYRGGTVPTTAAERQTRILGFATGTFRIDAVGNFAIQDTPDIVESLSILIGDRLAEGSDIPAIVHRPGTRTMEIGHKPLGTIEAGGVRLTRSFSTLGQVWTLVFDFPPAVVAGLRSAAGWSYLLLGILLSFLLATYVAIEQRRRATVEAIVAERTHDLAHVNDSLRHEIGAREIAQGELIRAADQMKAMIEASPLAIICVDTQLRVLIWNRAAERTFGYSAEEVVGRAHPLIPDGDRDKFESRFQLALKGEVLRDIPAHRRRKDGTVIETSYSAAMFHDPSGAPSGVIYACEDLTDRNRIQQQLIHAQKMETVGQLTGGMAHDFNNILGAVIGNLDLLSERVGSDETASKYCKEALDAALSGAELVKRLLGFSRRQALRPAPTDIAAVVANMVPLLKRALGEQIVIQTKLASDLWPAIADPVQLESAILNLAVNARDAMPEGGTLLIDTANATIDPSQASAIDEIVPGGYVTISISDNGTGIAPDVLTRVFEPFFTTKSAGTGSGLGLSMVFGTMKQLGGTAKIYSEVGVGTTVRLYLPRARDEGAVVERPVTTADLLPSGHERILMAEDNVQMRTIGADILQSLGYKVTVARSGDDALQYLEAGERFDLLFTDVVMPGRLNGIALAHEMRASDPTIPIIFASGFASPLTLRAEIDALGADLILKPYRKSDLAALVRSVLDRGRKIEA